MKKKIIFITIAIILVAGIVIACNFPRRVTALHINSGTIRLESDMSKALSITVKPEKVYSFQYKLVSDNEFVAVCNGNTVCAVNEGETYVYATSVSGKITSNKIKVIVSNNLFEIAAKIILDTEEEPTEDDTEVKITTDKIDQITQNTVAKADVNTNKKTTPETADTPDISNDTVYVTASGTKFHLSTCAYAKTASPVPRSEAVSEGKTPCKKCNP